MNTTYQLSLEHLQNVRIQIAQQRREDRKARNIPEPTGEFAERERATIATEALKTMGNQQRVTTSGLLLGLWQSYLNGDHLLVSEYDSFAEWAFTEFENHISKDYLSRFIAIIERVFQYVHSNMVTTPDGKVITPELLMEEVGVGKLKIMSPLIESEMDIEKKDGHILAMLNFQNQDVATEYVKQARQEKITVRLPYIIHPRSDGLFDIELKGLTPEQLKKFELVVSVHGEERLSA